MERRYLCFHSRTYALILPVCGTDDGDAGRIPVARVVDALCAYLRMSLVSSR